MASSVITVSIEGLDRLKELVERLERAADRLERVEQPTKPHRIIPGWPPDDYPDPYGQPYVRD